MAEYAINVKSGTTASVLYVGEALPGAATANAVWRVRQVETVSGAEDAVIFWADGDTAFDNIMDNFQTLTYS